MSAGEAPRGPLVLVVDDETRILSALQRALRREPIVLRLVETPAAALDVLAREDVALLLSDYKMPGMSGLDLIGRARALRPGIACILLTGWTEDVPREPMQRLAVRALLPKPWDDAALKRAVHEALGAPAGGSAPR